MVFTNGFALMIDRKSIHTDRAPAAIGPYSQAICAGGMVFVSGQIALDPQSGTLVDSSVEAETEQVIRNLAAVLEASGTERSKVVKTTIYLTNMGDFAAMNAVYGKFFGETPPARATVQVTALPAGARVEIDAIALVANPSEPGLE